MPAFDTITRAGRLPAARYEATLRHFGVTPNGSALSSRFAPISPPDLRRNGHARQLTLDASRAEAFTQTNAHRGEGATVARTYGSCSQPHALLLLRAALVSTHRRRGSTPPFISHLRVLAVGCPSERHFRGNEPLLGFKRATEREELYSERAEAVNMMGKTMLSHEALAAAPWAAHLAASFPSETGKNGMGSGKLQTATATGDSARARPLTWAEIEEDVSRETAALLAERAASSSAAVASSSTSTIPTFFRPKNAASYLSVELRSAAHRVALQYKERGLLEVGPDAPSSAQHTVNCASSLRPPPWPRQLLWQP